MYKRQSQEHGALSTQTTEHIPDPESEHSLVALPAPIVVFWAALLTTFLLSLSLAVYGFQAHLATAQWDPFSDPLLGDLMEYPATYQQLHSSAFFNNASPGALPSPMFSAVAYPPFTAAVLAPLYLMMNPLCGFFSAAAAWLLIAFWSAKSYLQRSGFSATASSLFLISIVLTSFPIARLVHQGNVELLVWLFTATGTWAYLRERHMTAAVLWGFAGAMKLYPAVLLVLFLLRRKPGALLAGTATGACVTWLSLWWIGPDIASAWRGSVQNVVGYQNLRASEWTLRELAANHSWFSWTKIIAALLHIPSEKLLLPYYVCCAVLLAVAAKRLCNMPSTNQLLALHVFMLASPSISYFHTLVHLYAPLLELISHVMRTRRNRVIAPGVHATLLLFVPLFAPYTLLLYRSALLFSGLLQSLALILLMLCALKFPLCEPRVALQR